jgi:hypothetical protein
VRRCRGKRCPGSPIKLLRRWRNGHIARWIRYTWRSPVDAIVVKVRDGQVANRTVYAVIGVTLEGRKDVLGLTMGTGGGEGAKLVDERARRPGRIGVCATCSSSSATD